MLNDVLLRAIFYVFFAIPGLYIVSAAFAWSRDPKRSDMSAVRTFITNGCIMVSAVNCLLLLLMPEATGYLGRKLSTVVAVEAGLASYGFLHMSALVGSGAAVVVAAAASLAAPSPRRDLVASSVMQLYLFVAFTHPWG